MARAHQQTDDRAGEHAQRQADGDTLQADGEVALQLARLDQADRLGDDRTRRGKELDSEETAVGAGLPQRDQDDRHAPGQRRVDEPAASLIPVRLQLGEPWLAAENGAVRAATRGSNGAHRAASATPRSLGCGWRGLLTSILS